MWSLVREFGDAELASLVAPRALVVEAAKAPEVTVRRRSRTSGAAPPRTARLRTPAIDRVRFEVQRARTFYANLKSDDKLQLVESGAVGGLPGSEQALEAAIPSGRSEQTACASPVSLLVESPARLRHSPAQLSAAVRCLGGTHAAI